MRFRPLPDDNQEVCAATTPQVPPLTSVVRWFRWQYRACKSFPSHARHSGCPSASRLRRSLSAWSCSGFEGSEVAMSPRLQTREKPAPTPSSTPVRTDLLQRKCACGGTPGPDGECAGCRQKRLSWQRRTMEQTEPATVPSIVHDVLRSPGQPLDFNTRNFMEPRFGHDFSRVRVHTDAKAAESARAVNALAYTVGHDMAFGAGQYVPETSEGRRLVAHELAHVVQQITASNQLRPADFASSSVGSDVLQRKPDKPTQAEARRKQQLEELARDPGEAHQAWKKLSSKEKFTVQESMRRRYGE